MGSDFFFYKDCSDCFVKSGSGGGVARREAKGPGQRRGDGGKAVGLPWSFL